MPIKYDKNINSIPIDDELHNSVGAGFNSLDHDTFFGSTDFEIWDTAARGGVQLVENINYTLHDIDSVLTTEAGKNVYTTYKVITPAYQAVDLFFWYDTVGDYNEAADINPQTITVSAVGPTDDVDVSGIQTIFIDTTANHVTIGGFIGGIDGQRLHIVKIALANDAILEHIEGTGNQDIYLHAGADENIDGHYGGWALVCYNGVAWYDDSHARHV